MAHATSRWEGKQAGKKKNDELGMASDTYYYDNGHYKQDSFNKSKNKAFRLKKRKQKEEKWEM